MNLVQFQTLRNGLQHNAAPVSSQMRKVFETGLKEELLASGTFEEVEVGGSDDPDRLVLALCTYRAEVSDQEAVAAVEDAWAALAFHHWSAHAFLTGEGHVELQAASLDRPAGHFVSLHVVAQRAGVAAAAVSEPELPGQRRPETAPAEDSLAHTA